MSQSRIQSNVDSAIGAQSEGEKRKKEPQSAAKTTTHLWIFPWRSQSRIESNVDPVIGAEGERKRKKEKKIVKKDKLLLFPNLSEKK